MSDHRKENPTEASPGLALGGSSHHCRARILFPESGRQGHPVRARGSVGMRFN